MSRDERGFIIVSYPDNTRLYFDTLGRVAKMTDRNLTKADGSDGNAMQFVYGARGELAAVIDPTGRAVKLAYNSAGLIATVTDFDNRVVTYKYDASGRMTSVDGPDPESPNSGKPATAYVWDTPANTGTKPSLYTSGRITAERDALSRTVWTAVYDSGKPWSAQTLTSGGGTWAFTLSPDATSVLDPNGHHTDYARDAHRRITAMTEPGGATTTYGFDTNGRLASVTRPLGDKTAYDYARRRATIAARSAT